MKIRAIYLISSLLATSAQAAECVVKGNADSGTGSLRDAITQLLNGGCVTNGTSYQAQYEANLPVSPKIQLIRFSKGGDIRLSSPLPEINSSTTALILADASVTVRLLNQTLTIGSNVIVDHITVQDVDGVAIDLRGNDSLVTNSNIVSSGRTDTPAVQISGNRVSLIGNTIANNRGIGIAIEDGITGASCTATPSGQRAQLSKNKVFGNAASGIRIHAPFSQLRANEIHHNQGSAIRVVGEPGPAMCPVAYTSLYTSLLSENSLHHNNEGVIVTPMPLAPPVDLIDVSLASASHYRIVGNIGDDRRPNYPWTNARFNIKGSRVELFLTETGSQHQGSVFIASSPVTDPINRQFIISVPKPLIVNGQAIANPIFVATVSDPEHGNTSPYSEPLDIAATTDWDRDGLPNYIEDKNQDGIVNLESGETNPRLIDSDGDGLTDGEETLFKTGFEEMLQFAISAEALRKETRLLHSQVAPKNGRLKDLSRLNPTLADSDGDCLPDGMELGIAAFEYPKLAQSTYSVLKTPQFVISSVCLASLKLHQLYKLDIATPSASILMISNALLRDIHAPVTVSNIMGIYDTNPTTHTDPTNADTDEDGLPDGAEDWNWDGTINMSPDGKPLESDPNKPDSDGDGLLDGMEDKNSNGILDKDETSPLLSDTDNDGVTDQQEVKSGANPTLCDSDGDGLSDGIENNQSVTNPSTGCPGAPMGGSNFKYPAVLNSHNTDSDGDGLSDGEEDANHNGWLDPMESDPTTPDTDGDGISDYVEMTGDSDYDGIPDFFLGDTSNGSKCSPATSMADLDCDGLSNAQDTDSDNDGCPDRVEGMGTQGSQSIPAAYTNASKTCSSSTSSGSNSGGGSISSSVLSGGGNASPSVSDVDPNTGLGRWNGYWAGRTDGGGDCSLIRPVTVTGNPPKAVFFLAALLAGMLVTARNKLRPKS